MTTVAFLGPALGRHEGWVTTQGEVLAGLFDQNEGMRVRVSSRSIPPLRRGLDHAADLLRWRRDLDVAVVSVFSGRAFALADEALVVARTLRIPTVAWLHGGSLPEFGERHPRWSARVLRQADAVVAPTEFLRRWSTSMGQEATVIPNVLDIGAYPYRVRDPLQPKLLWMRTFQELYDPLTAVRTVAELRRRGVDATLTMAGQEKGLLGDTQRLVEDLELNAVVSFAGFVAGGKKLELLEDHDIFLNTNVVDNAPVSVLEAAASGLAVVSSRVGGLPDLLPDGFAARLVTAGEPGAFADAVEGLLVEPSLVKPMVQAARAVAERSGWDAVREQWLDLFRMVNGELL